TRRASCGARSALVAMADSGSSETIPTCCGGRSTTWSSTGRPKSRPRVGLRPMSLPLFPTGDPGPSFSELLKRVGGDQVVPQRGGGGESAPQGAHGTTIVAIRYAEGVVMAGDRRA